MKNIKIRKVKGSEDVVLSIRFDPRSNLQSFLGTLVNYSPIVDWKSEFSDFCEELRYSLEHNVQADINQTSQLNAFLHDWFKATTKS
jgi:hypothetical protein